jgi:hypothetical protein
MLQRVPSHGGWSQHPLCAGNTRSAKACSWDFHELQSDGPDAGHSNDGNYDDKEADMQEVPVTAIIMVTILRMAVITGIPAEGFQ